MRAEELKSQRVQIVNAAGPILNPSGATLIITGIHGADDHAIGLRVVGTPAAVWRRPADPITAAPRESTDALRERVMRDLPPGPRHQGYFLYPGLPADHCAPKATV